MLRRALMSAAVGLVLTVAPATAALAHGSDSPTPYQVTSTAIVLPHGRVLGDNAHVNVHYTVHGLARSVNLSTEISGKPGHDLASTGELSWSRLGVPEGAYVTWVQVSGFDEHFGEGGQKPVCVGHNPGPGSSPSQPATPPATRPTPTPTATKKPCPTKSLTPAPSATKKPCPTKTPKPTSSAPAPAPTPTRSSAPTPTPSPTSVVGDAPTPSASPSSSPTTPAPAPSASAVVAAAGPTPSPSVTARVLADDSATAPDDAVLASTGADPLVPAALAAALVIVGAAVTLVARSRRRDTDAV